MQLVAFVTSHGFKIVEFSYKRNSVGFRSATTQVSMPWLKT